MRAVHLEVAHALDIDSCIMALRRFFARRARPAVIFSDGCTNQGTKQHKLRREQSGASSRTPSSVKADAKETGCLRDRLAVQPTSRKPHGRCVGEGGQIRQDVSALGSHFLPMVMDAGWIWIFMIKFILNDFFRSYLLSNEGNVQWAKFIEHFYFTSLEFGNMICWRQEPAIKISLIIVHFHIIGSSYFNIK